MTAKKENLLRCRRAKFQVGDLVRTPSGRAGKVQAIGSYERRNSAGSPWQTFAIVLKVENVYWNEWQLTRVFRKKSPKRREVKP